jgi:hypothetical protein
LARGEALGEVCVSPFSLLPSYINIYIIYDSYVSIFIFDHHYVLSNLCLGARGGTGCVPLALSLLQVPPQHPLNRHLRRPGDDRDWPLRLLQIQTFENILDSIKKDEDSDFKFETRLETARE